MPIIVNAAPSTAAVDYMFDLDGFVFGIDQPVIVEAIDLGDAEWTTQDTDNPVGDGGFFGIDYLRPPSWTFDLGVNMSDVEGALAMLGTLGTFWRNQGRRSTPGVTSTLRYTIGGRTRRVYGRPRRWAPVDVVSQGLWQGYAKVLADFKLIDPLHYDDAERSLVVGILPATTGGLKSPLVAPLTSLTGGARQGVIADTGTSVSTPVRAVIEGPISNPYIAGDGWRVELRTTLAYDQTVTIDARPWVNTVLRDDGASLAGTLTRSSRLSAARLGPGATELLFGGTDGTSTARCTAYWRPASETF